MKSTRVKAAIIPRLLLASVLFAMAVGPCAASGGKIPEEIKKSTALNARLWGLPHELVLGVIKAESGFNPKAQSPKGAIGLMQIVPHTGGRDIWKIIYKQDHTPSKRLLKTPHANITLGTAYLSHLFHTRLRGVKNKKARKIAALAAYNWGVTRVKRLLKRHGVPKSDAEMYRLIKRYSPPETAKYVTNVLIASIQYAREL